jgi:hypothetical protein
MPAEIMTRVERQILLNQIEIMNALRYNRDTVNPESLKLRSLETGTLIVKDDIAKEYATRRCED